MEDEGPVTCPGLQMEDKGRVGIWEWFQGWSVDMMKGIFRERLKELGMVPSAERPRVCVWPSSAESLYLGSECRESQLP